MPPLFRVSAPQEPRPESPSTLFRDLVKGPGIKFLWAHQEKLLDEYHRSLAGKRDVAVELPTGSGKTLVGMLIGEYRRRAFGERVAFLCPNRQLCCQVEAQAKKYGISASLLIGKQKDYDPAAFSKYQQAKAIAVTTYSGLFNGNPKICDPQTIVCDDAHAADGFVAKMWTFRVDRDKHNEFFLKLYYALRPAVPAWLASYVESYEGNPRDRDTFDLVTTVLAADCFDAVRAAAREAMPDDDELKYPWAQLHQNLDSCLVFCAPHAIEIRPVIPPTMTHAPFSGAKQRVYMSATLGEDGSIERSFGVRKIDRLPIPEGWDKKGTGRRLVLFPHLAGQDESVEVMRAVVGESDRALVLVPSEPARAAFEKHLPGGYAVLGSGDVEKDLSAFTQRDRAILLLANRYDGIDLPGNDCRMLVLVNKPAGASFLERYFNDKLGATSVLRERVRTRITQALGRCTRDEGDYSVVLLMGGELLDWCSTSTNVDGVHPELQAEIAFGLENSLGRPTGEMVELCRAFLARSEEWRPAELDIQDRRQRAERRKESVTEMLAKAAALEIDHVVASWGGRHDQAHELAVKVTEQLQGGIELLPYRSFWYHQAAVSAFLAHRQSASSSFKQTAADMLGRASESSHGVRWLPDVRARLGGPAAPADAVLPVQDWFLVLKGLLETHGRIGTRCGKAVATQRTNVEARESGRFEQGLEMLGRLLGARAVRFTEPGKPDGFWLFGDWLAFVFEAKTDEGAEGGVSFDTVRQAGRHETTVRALKLLPDHVPCRTVVISPRTGIDQLAVPHAGEMFHLSHAAAVALFDRASRAFEEVRAGSTGNTDEALRDRFLRHYDSRQLAMQQAAAELQKSPLAGLPVK